MIIKFHQQPFIWCKTLEKDSVLLLSINFYSSLYRKLDAMFMPQKNVITCSSSFFFFSSNNSIFFLKSSNFLYFSSASLSTFSISLSWSFLTFSVDLDLDLFRVLSLLLDFLERECDRDRDLLPDLSFDLDLLGLLLLRSLKGEKYVTYVTSYKYNWNIIDKKKDLLTFRQAVKPYPWLI